MHLLFLSQISSLGQTLRIHSSCTVFREVYFAGEEEMFLLTSVGGMLPPKLPANSDVPSEFCKLKEKKILPPTVVAIKFPTS